MDYHFTESPLPQSRAHHDPNNFDDFESWEASPVLVGNSHKRLGNSAKVWWGKVDSRLVNLRYPYDRMV